MKLVVCFLVVCAAAMSNSQQQAAPAPDPLNSLSFMKGDWSGKQNFDTGGGPAMVGDATDRIEIGIAGKYLCEMLSTTLPGRKPTDTRHFISYDKQSGKYTAWWFNDTSTHPDRIQWRSLREQARFDQQFLRSGTRACAPPTKARRTTH